MKIAYVVPYVPNLIRTRPYNLISQLAELGHDVTVFTLGSGSQDQKDVDVLRSKGVCVHYQKQPVWYSLWHSLRVIPSRRPLQTAYSWNPLLANNLVSLLSDRSTFDVVHVEHLRGSLYGQYVKSKFPDIPLVWDSVDCISYLFQQALAYSTSGFGKFISRFEFGRTKRMEGKLIGEFDQVLVSSETDKKALLDLILPRTKPARISVLSNGVDLDYFHPNPTARRDSETLVISGKMSYHANISMVKYLATEIMPMVWQKRPEVRLMIVGKEPTSDIRALGTDPRIIVTGTVNDIRPYLWKATVSVVPLVYGAGIQNKVLEAMACGTPVVATPKVLSSLKVNNGKELLVAEGASEFAESVLDLLEDPKLQIEIGSGGLSYVKNHHSWTVMANQLLVYYNQTIEENKNLS